MDGVSTQFIPRSILQRMDGMGYQANLSNSRLNQSQRLPPSVSLSLETHIHTFTPELLNRFTKYKYKCFNGNTHIHTFTNVLLLFSTFSLETHIDTFTPDLLNRFTKYKYNCFNGNTHPHSSTQCQFHYRPIDQYELFHCFCTKTI